MNREVASIEVRPLELDAEDWMMQVADLLLASKSRGYSHTERATMLVNILRLRAHCMEPWKDLEADALTKLVRKWGDEIVDLMVAMEAAGKN